MPREVPLRQLRGRVVKSTGDEKPLAAEKPQSSAGKDPGYVCPTCSKRFASSTSLETHKKTHTAKNAPEVPQKRRAVAAASTAPEPKKAKIEKTRKDDPHTAPAPTRPSRFKCKWCDETFTNRDVWTAHVRDQHAGKSSVAPDAPAEPVQPRTTRRSVAAASSPPAPSVPVDTGVYGQQQRSAVRRSPSPTSLRSRNTTLRFEEETPDGNIQCRECQAVFNNRRGLAAHVAQKHRNELDTEQQAIEEDKQQQKVRRTRTDLGRIHLSPTTIMTSPQAHHSVAILGRRPGAQQPGFSGQRASILRTAGAPATPKTSVQQPPRRSTLEILTQPAAASQQSLFRSSVSSPESQSVYEQPSTISSGTAAAETAMPAQILDEDKTIEDDGSDQGDLQMAEDVVDEATYEFSTEVTMDTGTAAGHTEHDSRPPPQLSPPQTVDARPASGSHRMQPPNLESHADPEVDNYPCKFCKDRMFLTSYGLERHTKMSHAEHLEEVLHDIQKFQMEKARRYEAARYSMGDDSHDDDQLEIDERDSMAYDDDYPDRRYRDTYKERYHPHYARSSRQGGRSSDYGRRSSSQQTPSSGDNYRRSRPTGAGAVEKENEPMEPSYSDAGEVIQIARQQSAALVAGASFTDNRAGGRQRRSNNDVARAKYQSCDICGILINTEHPKAMESHTKAHQKNQELRDELLRTFGRAWVERVTCRECNLVFKDEDKLEQHRRNVHVRRRHFLCRFCGDVFRNMRDLNMHKERRHEAYEGHRRPNGSSPPLIRRPPPPASRRHDTAGEGGPDDFACRSTCEICGLQMQRPSNLIRHMKQFHNKTNFTATVETRGMPPFKIDVSDGRFMWGCCDEVFDDRQAFINHRRIVHGPSYVGNPKECEHCGLTFKNNVSYVNHLRTHRPRVCNICGESFGNSVVDLNAFRAHIIRHREQGYNVRVPSIEEELATKEQQELWRAIEEEECDDGSEDEYSIFSESGVESNIEDDSDPEDTLETTCPVCEKTFSCVYRFSDHWKLHCRQPYRDDALPTLKTKPFDYKTKPYTWNCTVCRKRFKRRETLALHRLACVKRYRGILPEEEQESVDKTPSSSPTKTASTPSKTPSKTSPAKTPTVASSTEMESESMKELEDQLEVRAKAKKYTPDFIEKAYVVEWDSSKQPHENPYQCRACDNGFADFLNLIMHVKTHVVNPVSDFDERKIDEDDEATPRGKLVVSENETDKNEKVTASVLRVRSSTMENLGKHPCQVCGRCFKEEKELKMHLDDLHRPHKQNRCRMCRKRFWTATALRRHSRRHNTENHYCQTCGKKFANAEKLTKHESFHELVSSLYQCEDCSLSFYGLKQLQAHFKECHEGVAIITCPVCARIHTDWTSMTAHFEQDHPTVRTYCKICGKEFHTPMEARRHRERAHMAKEPFEKCTLCAKKFYDKRTLAVHEWRHTGTKGSQCLICDEAFEDAEQVRTHLETSHDVGWLDSRDLIVNNMTVFGEDDDNLAEAEKCFSCFVCGKKFGSKTLVRRHATTAHKREKKHTCEICGWSFTKPWLLKAHIDRRHLAESGKQKAVGTDQETEKGQQADGQSTAQTTATGSMQIDQGLPVDVAQLLANQEQLGNVQYVVADEATVAAVMAAAAASGDGQEYQVVLVEGDEGQLVQTDVLEGQAGATTRQAGVRGATQQQPGASGGGQPMEIDESNYQQFLNQ